LSGVALAGCAAAFFEVMTMRKQEPNDEDLDPLIAKVDDAIKQLQLVRAELVKRHTQFLQGQTDQSSAAEPHWLMTATDIARELRLAPVTVRLGEAGTDCLKRGSIKLGSNRFWPRVRVEHHKRMLLERGTCNGSCEQVILPDVQWD
jgi:hypothetical protein